MNCTNSLIFAHEYSCDIRNVNFVNCKSKLFVSRYNRLDVVNMFDEIRFALFANLNFEFFTKTTIYDKIFTYYFWSRMIDTIIRYVKNCHQCKKIKTYRKNKQKLLKSLFISNRYFQNISINFITFLSICKRNDKNYEHIMIIMNRFFKKKIFR